MVFGFELTHLTLAWEPKGTLPLNPKKACAQVPCLCLCLDLVACCALPLGPVSNKRLFLFLQRSVGELGLTIQPPSPQLTWINPTRP